MQILELYEYSRAGTHADLDHITYMQTKQKVGCSLSSSLGNLSSYVDVLILLLNSAPKSHKNLSSAPHCWKISGKTIRVF